MTELGGKTMSKKKTSDKLTLTALILMIFTSVFGFGNMPRSFYLMGYAAIPWYIVSALVFFIPFAFMIAEYGAAFKDEAGGMYSWMERSKGSRFAFICTFMWYASYIVWMAGCSGLWVTLSHAVFGEDRTPGLTFIGGDSVKTMGVLGILWIVFVTYVGSRGVKNIAKVTSIGGTACALMNIVLLVGGIAVALKNGGLAEPMHNLHKAMTISPHPDYKGTIGAFSFLTFAVFSFGGLEVVGGLVDQTEDAEKTFPKGIKISAIVIAIGYVIGIFAIGMFTNWDEVLASKNVHMGNISYVTIGNLGYQFAKAFGASEAGCIAAQHLMKRILGIAIFLAATGAFFTLSYSPLKTLIQGAPKEMWPGRLGELEDGMPRYAMWVQCAVVCVILFLISFGGAGAEKFFMVISLMMNVAMSIPYFFLAIAFKSFKEKQLNGEISSDFKVYKSQKSATFFAYLVAFVIAFANIFAIIKPLLSGDIKDSLYMILGPVIFGIIGARFYGKFEKKHAPSKAATAAK